MTPHPPMDVQPAASSDAASYETRVRTFATRVTLVLIVLCNVVFLVGIRISGVNLDELVETPDLFNPKSDVCLRLAWQRLPGASDPVRLCSEWINLSDPTGKPHTLDKDTKVKRGADGRYYLDQGVRADFRLMGFVMFVVAVLVPGMLIRRYLVNRYRLQLEAAAKRQSTLLR